MRPLPGVTGSALLRDLEEVLSGAEGVRGAGYSLGQYTLFADRAIERLSRVLSADDVRKLVATPGYWTLRSMQTGTAIAVPRLVGAEIEACIHTLETIIARMKLDLARWRHSRLLVVPDTNVYLHHPEPFHEIAWSSLVPSRLEGIEILLPLLVIEELDKRKRPSERQEVRLRARGTLKKLNEIGASPDSSILIGHEEIPASPQPLTAEVRLRVLMDAPDHIRLPIADDEIADVARRVQEAAERPVYLVTFDVPMVMRAKWAGLKVVQLADE